MATMSQIPTCSTPERLRIGRFAVLPDVRGGLHRPGDHLECHAYHGRRLRSDHHRRRFHRLPLTYVIGDVVGGLRIPGRPPRHIFLGFGAMNILAALVFWVTIYLPAADFYQNQAH